MSHFNVSSIAKRAKSQDSVHKPQVLKTESRSGLEPTSVHLPAYCLTVTSSPDGRCVGHPSLYTYHTPSTEGLAPLHVSATVVYATAIFVK